MNSICPMGSKGLPTLCFITATSGSFVYLRDGQDTAHPKKKVGELACMHVQPPPGQLTLDLAVQSCRLSYAMRTWGLLRCP